LGIIPLEKLIVHQTVSKNLNEYRTPVPAFSALQQLESAGKPLRLGQTVRLIYTLGSPCAHAWDAGKDLDLRRVNLKHYLRWLDRAIDTVLIPIFNEDTSTITQARQLSLFL
jgi:DNA polymerase elongation subunit (family B)